MVISYVASWLKVPAVCNFRRDRENPYQRLERMSATRVSSEKLSDARRMSLLERRAMLASGAMLLLETGQNPAQKRLFAQRR